MSEIELFAKALIAIMPELASAIEHAVEMWIKSSEPVELRSLPPMESAEPAMDALALRLIEAKFGVKPR